MEAYWSVCFAIILFVGSCVCIPAEDLKDTKFAQHHDIDPDDFDHQAIIGSEKEDKENDELSWAESKEKLKKVFHMIDTNGDKYIDHDELKLWISKSFENMNVEGARDQFEQRDAILDDQDEQISWEEYVKETYGQMPDELDLMKDKEEYKMEEKEQFFKNLELDRKRFGYADVDNNNFLSEQEHAAFVHPYDYEHMTQAEVDQYLSDQDTDGDDKLTVDEFAKTRDENVEQDLHRETEIQNFRSLDKNRDGFLDMSELEEMLKPDADEIAEGESHHLFQKTDKDLDKKLTLNEVLDAQDIWIGSEATAFGDFVFGKDEL